MTQTFYPMTPYIGQVLRSANLTATEWSIWSYLIELDMWGDRYVEIEPLKVMENCGCSKSSFYRAIAKLQSLNLFDFQTKGFFIKNENGASKLKPISHVSESSPKNETGGSKLRIVSQSSENQSPEPTPDKACSSPHTIQTLQTIHTLSDKGERENELNLDKGNNEQDLQVQVAEDCNDSNKTHIATPVVEVIESKSSAILSSEKKYNSPLPWIPQRNPQAQANDWIPEGPWRIDGKLDEEFLDWKARQYMRDYGDDYHAARANARLHFQKGIEKIASAWEHYHDVMSHKAVNLSVRAANGSSVGESEVAEIQRHSRALAPLPEETTASDLPWQAALRYRGEFVPEYAKGTVEALYPGAIAPEGADNISSYKIYKAEDDFTPEQLKENQIRLKQMFSCSGIGSLRPPLPETSSSTGDTTSSCRKGMWRREVATLPCTSEPTLVRLNRLLADPNQRIKPHVQLQAKCLLNSDRNLVAEWQDGMICEIYDDSNIAF